MKHRWHKAILLVTITLVHACSSALAEENNSAAFDFVKRMGNGINLGNALEAPTEGEWGVVLKEEYFIAIRDAGFTNVRLPVKWSAHALETAPYTIDPLFMDRVEWAISEANKNE